MTKQRLIMGNWKMNGSLATNKERLDQLLANLGASVVHNEIVVFAPHPYLAQMQHLLTDSPITWGGQNINAAPSGAYTGEVSAQMLTDFSCKWVLVGHSERRSLYGESDEDVLAKTIAALQAGLKPVVCIGESDAEHQAGQTEDVLRQQLKPLFTLSAQQFENVVIAYEPVWAIGTGKSATPEQAQHVHAYIKQLLKQHQLPDVPVVYGGSVNAANAAQLFAMPDINGALVGGASLQAADFLSIAAV